jgi:periplasmic divalent cation tolerance protein
MDKTKTGVVMGMISAPEAEAETLAAGLVREKLAACAQVNRGIISYFWWEGKVEKEDEVLIFFKTKEELTGAVLDFVVKTHSYEVPECLFFPVTEGVPEYLEWVRTELQEGYEQ